ncbi:MAG TPA: hypothetical protein VF044_10105 [Actinomycetota bacterium]
MFRRRIRLRRRIAIALAVAAAVVPTAQAGVDDGTGSRALDTGPTIAELLFDTDRAIASLDGDLATTLALDRKADVFVPQPGAAAGDDTGWRELGTGAGIGVVAALFGAALALGISRRRDPIARA